MRNLFKITKIAACGGAMLVTVGSASAVTITFATSESQAPNPGHPSNVGTITLTQISPTTVDVFLDLLDTVLPSPKYGLLNTGGPHTPFAFQISGVETDVTANFITPSGGNFLEGGAGDPKKLTLNLGNPPTSFGGTPFGTYGIAIESSAGDGSGKAYYGDLRFELSRPTGLLTTDFVANTDGYYFVADLTDGDSKTGSSAWKTGVTVTTQSVPEGGATIALLGLTLLGLGGVRKMVRA